MKYLIIILLLAGCYSEKKAVKQVNHALENYKDTAVKIFRAEFPCVPGRVTTDSTAYKHWRTSFEAIKKAYDKERMKVPATIKEYIVDSVDCVKNCNLKIDGWIELTDLQARTIDQLQDKINSFKPIHDTVPIKDSADIYLLLREKQDSAVVTAAIRADNTILDNKVSKRNKWLLWLILGMAASFLCNYLQFKFKRK